MLIEIQRVQEVHVWICESTSNNCINLNFVKIFTRLKRGCLVFTVKSKKNCHQKMCSSRLISKNVKTYYKNGFAHVKTWLKLCSGNTTMVEGQDDQNVDYKVKLKI